MRVSQCSTNRNTMEYPVEPQRCPKGFRQGQCSTEKTHRISGIWMTYWWGYFFTIKGHFLWDKHGIFMGKNNRFQNSKDFPVSWMSRLACAHFVTSRVRTAHRSDVMATLAYEGKGLQQATQFHGLSWLVGGMPTPLKNMKVSWDDYSQYVEK